MFNIFDLGDLHDTLFEEYRRSATFGSAYLDDGTASGIRLAARCEYQIDIYPTDVSSTLHFMILADSTNQCLKLNTSCIVHF